MKPMRRIPAVVPIINASGHRLIQVPDGASRQRSMMPNTNGTRYKRSASPSNPGMAQLLIKLGDNFPNILGIMTSQKPTTIQ